MDNERWTAIVGDIVNVCQDLGVDGHAAFDEVLRAEVLPAPTAASCPPASAAVDALFQRHLANLEAAMTQFEVYAKSIHFTATASTPHIQLLPSSAPPADTSEQAHADCCAQVEALGAEVKVLQSEEERLQKEQRELCRSAQRLESASAWTDVLPEHDVDELKGKLTRLFDEACRIRGLVEDVENVQHMRGLEAPGGTSDQQANTKFQALTARDLQNALQKLPDFPQ